MLSDRTYMRDNYPRERASVLAWLLSALVAAFVLQLVFERILEMPGALEHFFALSPVTLRAGHVWTVFTYSFLHDTGNILHLVSNLLGLYFLGRALLPVLGAARFASLYALMVLAGAGAWAAANWQHGGSLVGASAGVAGLFVVFAGFYPNQPVTFLLFFVFPITLRPKYVAWAALAFSVIGCVGYEILGYASPLHFAHSAHLGGMAVGWIYYRFVHEANWSLPTRRSEIELPKWMKKSAQTPAPAVYQVNLDTPVDLRAEVDRILDKINSQGFGALTAEEKRRLDDAKDMLSRR